MMDRARRGAVLGIATLLLVGACGTSEQPRATSDPSPTPSSSPSPVAPEQGPTYVALGDSYTAGGLIGSFQEQGERCQRSSQNYPTLVAAELDLAFTDVSCGGATSDSVVEAGRGMPAQIDAITPKTRVVTVSIGGNDFGLYGKLILYCSQLSTPDASGAPCRDRLASEVTPLIPEIGAGIGEVLDAVSTKAPKAEVLLVGYPRLMPARGACDEAPYTAGDVAWISDLESELSATMSRAAEIQDVRFLPMYARSKGHDLCSGIDAWVNGLDPATGDGIVLHPNAAGEKAVADAVVKALR